jgi:hypothetical protein
MIGWLASLSCFVLNQLLPQGNKRAIYKLVERCAFIDEYADKKKITEKTLSHVESELKEIYSTAAAQQQQPPGAGKKMKEAAAAAAAAVAVECKKEAEQEEDEEEEVAAEKDEERKSCCSAGSSSGKSKVAKAVNKL